MKIKKVAGILLAGTMMISMAACGGKEEGAKSRETDRRNRSRICTI